MKKIIYHCYGSSHSSVISAAIHLGYLPEDKIPGPEEILKIPHYDRTPQEDIGTLFFMGRDQEGNEVYILGMKREKALIKKAFLDFIQIFGKNPNDIVFVDTLSRVNFITKIGGYISRRLNLISIGRPLTVYGMRKNYFKFVDLVKAVKKDLNTKNNEKQMG